MDAATLLGIFYVGVRVLVFVGIIYIAIKEIRREKKQ